MPQGDQRVVTLALTAKGRRLLTKSPQLAEGAIPDALARMPIAARARLEADLGQLLTLTRVRGRSEGLKPLAGP